MPAPSTPETALAELQDDFALLDDWEDRYRYVIELGRALPPLADREHCDANKVRGCASQVWLVSGREPDGRLSFRGDSDALIVKGLIAILLRLYSGRLPGEITAFDAQRALSALGLDAHLTAQRSNGVAAMVARIRADAAQAAAQAAAPAAVN